MATLANNLVDGGGRAAVRVRGLRADRTASVHHCLHCGVPLTAAATQTPGFCCAGCSYVYRLVHEQGLDGYYKMRDTVIAPAAPTVFEPRDYAWLATLQSAAEAADRAELTLGVQGISCAGCVWLIESLFDRQPGALRIETDAALGRMRLRWAKGAFDAPAFARTLQSFGYLVGPPGAEPAEPGSRALVRRIGLGAAFAMNVMLFTLPHYFGMAATFPYARLFDTLSLVFATLSLLTGGAYFIGRAAQALRAGEVHLDQPIALGILGAYLGSLYGWLSGREQFMYFDFVSAFILLMLVGRWAQTAAVERNRRRLLSAQAQPQTVRVGGEQRPVGQLQAGDAYSVSPGQTIPVESRLESSAATLGTAWITGESDPRDYTLGARVPAGALNLGRGELRLCATQPWSESLLAELLQPVARDAYHHRFLERIIRGYLIGILLVATSAGLGWWLASHDAVRTWAVVTAVLVVSCPCALGLAFPLTDEIAATALRHAGVFIREADLWPRLQRIRQIVFDKTGTLTLETPRLLNPEALARLSPTARSALLALVRDNAHPISRSLHEALASGAAQTVAAGDVKETIGFGVSLRTAEGRWTLGRPGWSGTLACEKHDTELALDGIVAARFQFEDAVRTGARAELDALRARGFEVYILSGDRRAKVEAMAEALGLPPENALGELSPHDKAAWLRDHDRRDTLMLGDGANDSLAFDVAFARGTPVIHRGVLERKADFYYLGRGLDGLRRLFEINAARRHTQAWLLAFSIVYNLLAVGLAVAGRVNPLLAAILMPVSSLLTLAIIMLHSRRLTGRSLPAAPASFSL